MTVFQIVNSKRLFEILVWNKGFLSPTSSNKFELFCYALGSDLPRLVKNRLKIFRIFWPSLLLSGKFPGQKIAYLLEARTEYNSFDFFNVFTEMFLSTDLCQRQHCSWVFPVTLLSEVGVTLLSETSYFNPDYQLSLIFSLEQVTTMFFFCDQSLGTGLASNKRWTNVALVTFFFRFTLIQTITMNGIDEFSIFVSQHRWYQKLIEYLVPLVVNWYRVQELRNCGQGKGSQNVACPGSLLYSFFPAFFY